MLDFPKLKTPSNDGEVLVAPQPACWLRAARENHDALNHSDAPLLDSTIAAWRRRTREEIFGTNDALIFALGHQPEFIHPGVWAKHIVARRAADATGGRALNLIVDNDAPTRTTLAVPVSNDGQLQVRSVPFAAKANGLAYELLPAWDVSQRNQFERSLREAMGDRYDASQMPAFFAALSQPIHQADRVDQSVAARCAVEARFGVAIDERRVSEVWCSPLLIDMLARPRRFAASYNRALKQYRREQRVRGNRRPIPDLLVDDQRCELPVWAYRTGEPRRRLFVCPTQRELRLFADRDEIGSVPLKHLRSCDGLSALLADVPAWRMRPRALTLTIWARLLLADLFVHGIGGAKYDRISDAIIRDYYGLDAPHMACVSATLHMPLPHRSAGRDDVRRLRHELRDLTFNPQRHLAGPELETLLAQREQAVQGSKLLRTSDPRNRTVRREAFERIRRINGELLRLRQREWDEKTGHLEQTLADLEAARVATGREYFFGLYDDATLEKLLAALPEERSFGV